MTTIERKIDAWGRVSFHGDDAIELLMRGLDITQLELNVTPEIETYNNACIEHDKFHLVITSSFSQPTDLPQIDAERRQATWWMPAEYLELDVRTKLLALCTEQIEIDRVIMEMDMFEERDLLPVLQLMCFLVDHWRMTGIVWGVGRGSSVASYCLFLIGIHRIHSIRYDLDIKEFLK